MDIKRVFNHSSINHQPLQFEQFYKAVLRTGVELNNNKIKELKKRLKLLNSKLTNKEDKMKPNQKGNKTETINEGESCEDEGEESER